MALRRGFASPTSQDELVKTLRKSRLRPGECKANAISPMRGSAHLVLVLGRRMPGRIAPRPPYQGASPQVVSSSGAWASDAGWIGSSTRSLRAGRLRQAAKESKMPSNCNHRLTSFRLSGGMPHLPAGVSSGDDTPATGQGRSLGAGCQKREGMTQPESGARWDRARARARWVDRGAPTLPGAAFCPSGDRSTGAPG